MPVVSYLNHKEVLAHVHPESLIMSLRLTSLHSPLQRWKHPVQGRWGNWWGGGQGFSGQSNQEQETHDSWSGTGSEMGKSKGKQGFPSSCPAQCIRCRLSSGCSPDPGEQGALPSCTTLQNLVAGAGREQPCGSRKPAPRIQEKHEVRAAHARAHTHTELANGSTHGDPDGETPGCSHSPIPETQRDVLFRHNHGL